MRCPECGKRGAVLETRAREDGAMSRRYRCTGEHRWSTLEMLASRQRLAPEAPMSPGEFKAAQAALGLTNGAVESLLRVSDQTIVNWRNGHTPVPAAVAMIMRLHAKSHD